ncbi:LAMI_0F03268g1_1 [Lachancea mirantina]|uniref:PAN2-PAN3 deadenylation complex subunit PAN3 n=1 Tax=Lachancea mirantina TaxID=1230905 RepID=A0A1G4JX21_9SACH|nr:LAMI_0F03268g1_1 [Lachancea mirantina]
MDKANADWAKEIPCKNITIYGFCKYENEGCIFNHKSTKTGTKNANSVTAGNNEDLVPQIQPSANQVGQGAQSASMSDVQNTVGLQPSQQNLQNVQNVGSKYNAKTAAFFTPSSKPTIIKQEKSTQKLGSEMSSASLGSGFISGFNPYAANFTPGNATSSPADTPPPTSSSGRAFNPYSAPAVMGNVGNVSLPAPVSGSSFPDVAFEHHHRSSAINPNFPTIYPPSHSILQYHLYAPDPPLHLQVSLKPNERTPEMLFIPNNLREELVKKNQAALQVFPASGMLPDIVGDYFGLVPLEFHSRPASDKRYCGHQNSLYKVFSNVDGKVYIMRRIHDVQIAESHQLSKAFQAWEKVECSNVVKLRDAFVSRAFNDSSLCMVQDYYPQSPSLLETHQVSFSLTPITQDLLWAYLVQMCSAIQEVHSQNLALQNICLEKVIVTGSPGRIKVADCGTKDILLSSSDRDLFKEQQQDFRDLGSMLKELVSKMTGVKNSPIEGPAIDEQFKNAVDYLCENNSFKTLQELMGLISHKILPVMTSFQNYAEYTESILSRELENGRLFRLMCKLSCIFGRTESRVDINWSESGDKFPIVLFYDYVFHQVDETGKPVMDLTHVLRCLNKLDAGVSERLMLATPDELNCIIISYKELKDLIDSTFRMMTQ